MAPLATGNVPPVDRIRSSSPASKQSIEEIAFSAALICLEGHYNDDPPIPGHKSRAKVTAMVTKTLEKTHSIKEVREALSTNVEIWIHLTKIFAAAVPNLSTRSVGPLSSLNDLEKSITSQESTQLIVKNHAGLKQDLQILNKLMHIARNLVVTTVAQELCAAVSFDQMVYQTIILCINVTSKGSDGEVLDNGCRAKLNEITELYKKLLITSLQQVHNWTAKNDRNKMAFWCDVMFDEDPPLAEPVGPEDGSGFRPDVAKTEVQNWLERNSVLSEKTRSYLKAYVDGHLHKPPAIPAPICPLAGNWIPGVKARSDDPKDTRAIDPQWDENETDKFEQDKRWGRVSHEIDKWWEHAIGTWNAPMPSIDSARARHEYFAQHFDHRYPLVDDEPAQDDAAQEDRPQQPPFREDDGNASRNLVQEYVDDMIDEDDLDDNESYGEGPMNGILTEIPNILDPKQIEALHMIIKSCILDTMGNGLTRFGENLQKTRCRMLLALDCGKSLLREILVFIAVWEKDEQSLIFEITTQIVEALHDVALIPAAWNSLRIPKDVISPAQAVLLRLVNHMFRKRYLVATPAPIEDDSLDLKLAHYLFGCVRTRIVPECLAFMRLQGEIRRGHAEPMDFPVDNWDMERARDGLAQVLDFLVTVAEITEMRAKLIEWNGAFELISLLKGLEDAVDRKPLVDPVKPAEPKPADSTSSTPVVERPYSQDGDTDPPPPPPPPPAQEPAHKFAWAGIKIQILTILAHLLQPAPGKDRPGNPVVQKQIMDEKGIVALLNCCAYDDHNRYARERVQLCLKYLMDGSEAANNFLKELMQVPSSDGASSAPPGQRVDGWEGRVRIVVNPEQAQAQAQVRKAPSAVSSGGSSTPSSSAAAAAAAAAPAASSTPQSQQQQVTPPPPPPPPPPQLLPLLPARPVHGPAPPPGMRSAHTPQLPAALRGGGWIPTGAQMLNMPTADEMFDYLMQQFGDPSRMTLIHRTVQLGADGEPQNPEENFM